MAVAGAALVDLVRAEPADVAAGYLLTGAGVQDLTGSRSGIAGVS